MPDYRIEPNPRIDSDREVNYYLPPAVALSDRLLPRYKISTVDYGNFQTDQFTKSKDSFIVSPDDPMDQAAYISLLNTPVFSTLEFPIAGALSGFEPVGTLARQSSGVALRIDMAIIVITQTKNIVKTTIQGRNGTIKEYIGDGDYMIDIQGAIVSPYPNYYPKEEVKQFLDIMKIQSQIPIAGAMFELFNINQVVVEDYKIREIEGTRNVVPFSISCSSDGDDSIVINNIETIW